MQQKAQEDQYQLLRMLPVFYLLHSPDGTHPLHN